MRQARFVFGGGYWKGFREFGLVNDHGVPYVYTRLHKAEESFRLACHHSHLYGVSEDGKTLTLVHEGEVRSDPTYANPGQVVTAPQTVELTDRQIESIKSD